MKDTVEIVVLDGYTLNPGDLSWEGLEEFGACTVYDRTPPGDVVSRALNARIVLTNKTVLDRPVIERLPNLAYIGVTATGYNVVDIEAAAQRGIPVTNVPEYGTMSVAQMTFALILELTQHTGLHAETVRRSRWATNPDFCYWETPLIELDSLTIGIVGYGRIGRAVARIARAFGMNVLVHDIRPVSPEFSSIAPSNLDDLLRTSDVVTLHCPLTTESEGFINAASLGMMKPSALLINTGRGPLVNERDLAEALNAGLIAGAGLDVLTVEPPGKDNPLLTAKNCIITPHIAWATLAARKRLMETVVANVRAFLAGLPENTVNGV